MQTVKHVVHCMLVTDLKCLAKYTPIAPTNLLGEIEKVERKARTAGLPGYTTSGQVKVAHDGRTMIALDIGGERFALYRKHDGTWREYYDDDFDDI